MPPKDNEGKAKPKIPSKGKEEKTSPVQIRRSNTPMLPSFQLKKNIKNERKKKTIPVTLLELDQHATLHPKKIIYVCISLKTFPTHSAPVISLIMAKGCFSTAMGPTR